MRNHKRSVLVLLTVLSVAMVTVMAALRGQTQNSSPSQNSSANKEDPTPIQEGVMTEKQKEHSKTFKGIRGSTGGRKLRDVVTEQGDVTTIETLPDEIRRAAKFNLLDYLQDLTCKSDAIIVGIVKSKDSQLTEAGTFIFTDYEMAAEEVLKNNLAAPIQQGGDITIIRPGGAVKLNGHMVRAIHLGNDPLQIGQHYLLYLKFNPTVNAYEPFPSYYVDSFQLLGDKIIQVSGRNSLFDPHRPIPVDAALFMSEVHSVLTSTCGGAK